MANDDLPDFEYDPTGHLKSRLDRMEAGQAFNHIRGAIAQSEAQFASEHEDYYDALNHIRDKEISAMKKSGVDENTAKQRVFHGELQAATAALQQGMNPAEYAYSLARERYGYQGGTQEGRDGLPEFEEALSELSKDIYE